MNLGRTGIKILDLRLDARDELYLLIDKHYRPMPKDATGKIDPEARGLADNDIDAPALICQCCLCYRIQP